MENIVKIGNNREKQKSGNRFSALIYALIFIGFLVVLVHLIDNLSKIVSLVKQIESIEYKQDEFRRLAVDPKAYQNIIDYCDRKDKNPVEVLSILMLCNDYDLSSFGDHDFDKFSKRQLNSIRSLEDYQTIYNQYSAIFADAEVFPVPQDVLGKETVHYNNTWYAKRSYGGERFHEGCDLMSSNNLPGYFPIVSISDGVVEQKGWLELGGYRIGIRSPSGAYFYYAHLDSYAKDLEVGSRVVAGEVLGRMGSSGYGPEGTTGKFDVHLHFGIYLSQEDGEFSVNPYYLLRYLKRKQLKYYY